MRVREGEVREGVCVMERKREREREQERERERGREREREKREKNETAFFSSSASSLPSWLMSYLESMSSTCM